MFKMFNLLYTIMTFFVWLKSELNIPICKKKQTKKKSNFGNSDR